MKPWVTDQIPFFYLTVTTNFLCDKHSENQEAQEINLRNPHFTRCKGWLDTLQRSKRLKIYHYNKNKTSDNSSFHSSTTLILTVHVLLMLVLYEGVAPRLGVLRWHHHSDALDSTILLKLALQLALAEDRERLSAWKFSASLLWDNFTERYQSSSIVPGVKVDSSHKEGLERIAGGLQNRIGVPQCNLLFQFVGNLAEFKYKLTCKSRLTSTS